jgi:hypothetical protein
MIIPSHLKTTSFFPQSNSQLHYITPHPNQALLQPHSQQLATPQTEKPQYSIPSAPTTKKDDRRKRKTNTNPDRQTDRQTSTNSKKWGKEKKRKRPQYIKKMQIRLLKPMYVNYNNKYFISTAKLATQQQVTKNKKKAQDESTQHEWENKQQNKQQA